MPGLSPPQQQTAVAKDVPAPSNSGVEAERNVEGVDGELDVDKAALVDAAADDANTGEQLVAFIARLMRFNPSEGSDVLADAALMGRLAARMDSEQMTLGMLYLQADVQSAVAAVGAAGALTEAQWGRLIAGRTAAECLVAIQDSATFKAAEGVVTESAINAFPGLALDPGAFQQAFDTVPGFLAWILRTDGFHRAVEVLERLSEHKADCELREAYIKDGTYDAKIASFTEPTTEGREARRLHNWLLACNSADEAMKLFKKRFGVDLINQAATEDDLSTEEDETLEQADWDYESIVRVWQICGRLPPEQVATAASILREGTTGGAGGWATADGEIGMSWGTDEIGSTETGAFTEDLDPMRGLNVFDATMRHEIGHTVGAKNGFDADGGFVWTGFGWQEEEWRPLVRNVLAAKYSLGEGLTADEREFAIRGLAQAVAFDEESFEESINRVADNNGIEGLWDKVGVSELVDLLLGRAEEGAWEQAMDIDGRSYHVDYPPDGTWVSCPTSLYAKKVSTYAMRSPAEWFAEVYATFYADADRPGVQVGSTLAGRDAKAYACMVAQVHTLWNLFEMTGQSMGHDTMGV